MRTRRAQDTGTASLLCVTVLLLAAPRQAPRSGEGSNSRSQADAGVSPVGHSAAVAEGPTALGQQAEHKGHSVHNS